MNGQPAKLVGHVLSPTSHNLVKGTHAFKLVRMDIIDGEWTMRDSQLQLIFDELKTAYSPLKHTLSGFEDLPTSKAVKPKVKAAQKLQTYVKCGFEKCPVEFPRTQNTPKIRSNHTALHLALDHTREDERGLQQPKNPCGWCGSLK